MARRAAGGRRSRGGWVRPPFAVAIAVALPFCVGLSAPALAAPELPAGFSDEPVARVGAPIALAFTPGGELLIATKPGRLLVQAQDGGAPREVLDLRPRVCSPRYHDGLSGLTVDPEFEQNRFVYLAFTRGGPRCRGRTVSRLSRFVLPPGGVVDPGSEQVLLDRIPSPSGLHQLGDVQFGKDGFLYVSVGDGYCHYAGRGCKRRNPAAREDNVLLGKILRITRDGSAASGNRTGVSCARAGRARRGARCAEIFARGLRNPFRMAFDPNAADTRFFINDVGYRDWEEVNEGRQGADYGWNLREARCRGPRTRRCGPPPPGLTDPIHAYHHRTGCRAITGGAFVPAGVWPEPFSGDYLFADFICGRIFRLEPRDGGGYIAHSFATGLPVYSVVDIAFGPDPQGSSLYYAGFADGGQVRRISYTGPAAGRPGASRSYFLATAR